MSTFTKAMLYQCTSHSPVLSFPKLYEHPIIFQHSALSPIVPRPSCVSRSGSVTVVTSASDAVFSTLRRPIITGWRLGKRRRRKKKEGILDSTMCKKGYAKSGLRFLEKMGVEGDQRKR